MSTPISSPEGPVKLCPACETRVPVEFATCDICGHVFDAVQAAPDAVDVPAQSQTAEPKADRVIESAAVKAQPRPARPELAAPKFAAAAGSPALPGRSAWLIGLVSAAAVLLLSLAVLILKPQLGAQATAPQPIGALTLATAAPSTVTQPTVAVTPPTVAPPTVTQPTVAVTPPTAASPIASQGRVIGAVPSVALRSGAGTQFAVLRQLPPRQSVVIQCHASGGVPAAFAPDGSDKWVRVSVEGVVGFVYSALLETSGPLPECDTTQ